MDMLNSQTLGKLRDIRHLTGARGIAASLVGAAVTAVCAQIGFHLPGNPIPVTMQVFAVVLCGLLLGSRLGALAQLQYVLAGLAGAPVFFGFKSAALVAHTGGYIAAFIPAAFLVGLFVERSGNRSFAARCLAGLIGVGTIYAFGTAWLAVWMRDVSCVGRWLIGALPFVGFDIAKLVLAAKLSEDRN